MITKVAVISIWAEDVRAAAHFYRDVLGLRLLPHHGNRLHLEVNGIYLTIIEGKPAQLPGGPYKRFPLIAFATDDMDAEVDTLRRQGVEMPWGIEQDLDSRWVMFYDPAGNLIEIVQLEGG